MQYNNTELHRTTLQHAKCPKIERPDQIKTFVDQINGNILTAARRAVPSKQIRFKGPKWKASPAVRELLQQGKYIHKNWMDLGKPRFNHPIVDERRAIKRLIRSQQRQDIACERKQFYSQILEAEGSNSFYKLIRRGLSNTE